MSALDRRNSRARFGWTTGEDPNLMHLAKVDGGQFSEVHAVHTLRLICLTPVDL